MLTLLLLTSSLALSADPDAAPLEDAAPASAVDVDAPPAPGALSWPEGVSCGLSAENAALSRVLRIIEIKCDVRFEYAPGLADASVDVSLRDAPCDEAAASIAAAAGARLQAGDPGVVWVYYE